ncbi:hypothetical protein EKO27_g5543 [Xylaria grammica]|uniref:Uncharacterized protein n=1 Tax=Xylaria grammica TaxID=363999 RepID=A0A439D591_9PEZI|nr:hypothetical protein EKO27_g5543 [Xylaria grammica]
MAEARVPIPDSLPHVPVGLLLRRGDEFWCFQTEAYAASNVAFASRSASALSARGTFQKRTLIFFRSPMRVINCPGRLDQVLVLRGLGLPLVRDGVIDYSHSSAHSAAFSEKDAEHCQPTGFTVVSTGAHGDDDGMAMVKAQASEDHWKFHGPVIVEMPEVLLWDE